MYHTPFPHFWQDTQDKERECVPTGTLIASFQRRFSTILVPRRRPVLKCFRICSSAESSLLTAGLVYRNLPHLDGGPV